MNFLEMGGICIALRGMDAPVRPKASETLH